jgi:hypothetical protein
VVEGLVLLGHARPHYSRSGHLLKM